MKILILGAGFGGVEVIRLLQKYKNCEITVISDRNYFEYYPGLYHIAHGEKLFFSYVPLSYIFNSRVNLFIKTVQKIDSKNQSVFMNDGSAFSYDYLVIALGSEPNYFNTPGINADTVLSVKNYSYAEALHIHIEKALLNNPNTADDNMHHMVVIGGGPTGVELASDLTHFTKNACKKLESCKISFRIHLIDAGLRILKAFPEKASFLAHKRLEKLGVQVHLNERVLEKKGNLLVLGTGEIKTDTCIWSGGTKVVEVISGIEGFSYTTQKKIEVDEYMRAKGFENIFIVGDNAATQYSGLAQTAIADGYYVGTVLRRILKRSVFFPYSQKQNAYVVPVGSPWGVLVWKNKVFTGVIPFLGRYIIDTMYFFRILPLWKFILLPFRKFNIKKI